jgi:hypothetical protein
MDDLHYHRIVTLVHTGDMKEYLVVHKLNFRIEFTRNPVVPAYRLVFRVDFCTSMNYLSFLMFYTRNTMSCFCIFLVNFPQTL